MIDFDEKISVVAFGIPFSLHLFLNPPGEISRISATFLLLLLARVILQTLIDCTRRDYLAVYMYGIRQCLAIVLLMMDVYV